MNPLALLYGEIGSILIPLVFIGVAIGIFIHARRSSDKGKDIRKVFAFFALCMGTVLLILSTNYFITRSQHINVLRGLTPKSIISLQIANREISDPRHLAVLVEALNEAVPCDPKQGSLFYDSVPLKVVEKDGSAHQYMITKYFGEPGGFIQYNILCPKLPEALETIGIKLPIMRRDWIYSKYKKEDVSGMIIDGNEITDSGLRDNLFKALQDFTPSYRRKAEQYPNPINLTVTLKSGEVLYIQVGYSQRYKKAVYWFCSDKFENQFLTHGYILSPTLAEALKKLEIGGPRFGGHL